MTVPIALAALAALVLGAAGAACRGDAAGGSVEGPELFARLCSACHGPDGKPPEAMALRLGVRDLTAPEVRARLTPASVEQQLRHGSENKLMPSFVGVASEAQIKALAEYVASPAFLRKP